MPTPNPGATPITSYADLKAPFAKQARPRQQWGLGMEIEHLVLQQEDGHTPPFSLSQQLLQRLQEKTGWQPITEEGALLGLKGAVSAITLEPGGQIELSGQFCPDIHCAENNFRHHIEMLCKAAEGLGLVFIHQGTHPFSDIQRIPWLPKARYRIMAPYMTRSERLGQRMMKQTAGIQLNFDYSDEQDVLAKLQLCLHLAPLLYALTANSLLLEGTDSGWLAKRAHIWAETDPERCGIPLPLLQADAGWDTYIDYALHVPMYFLLRPEGLLDLSQQPWQAAIACYKAKNQTVCPLTAKTGGRFYGNTTPCVRRIFKGLRPKKPLGPASPDRGKPRRKRLCKCTPLVAVLQRFFCEKTPALAKEVLLS